MNSVPDMRILVYVIIAVPVLLTNTQCNSPTQSPADNIRVVTLAVYHQILDDMSLQEVQAVVGATGKERSRTDRGVTREFTWIWTNPDGSHVICTFRGSPDLMDDGRPFYSQLTSKLQEGL